MQPAVVTRPAGRSSARPFGDAAVQRDTEGPGSARALAAAARAAGWPGVRDVVCGLASVVVTVDPRTTPVDELVDRLGRLEPVGGEPAVGPLTVVPTVFDGDDLDAVARSTGLGPETVAELLTSVDLTVAVVGFSPGFAYLEGLPAPLRAVGRRSTPRPSVPAGSVALAGGFAAVYPRATPGGWHLVGRTSTPMFDPVRPPFARLAPGDRVRFTRADHAGPLPTGLGRAPRRRPGAAFSVDDPGPLTTVQDAGRVGVAHLGVPRAGPADPVAHALANRLVGNPAGDATLEVTLSGPRLTCGADVHLAVVGGHPRVEVDGREVGVDCVFPLEAGQQLLVGRTTSGPRAYVAVAGAFAVEAVLGSRSTDTLSGLGAGPLVTGDELAVGRRVAPLGGHLRAGAASPARGPRRLRVVAGPHAARFVPDALDQLAGLRFVVDPSSDRVGLRLRPTGASPPRAVGELLSQPMVLGAVQVPPSGEPVVLLPDHATLGGYPVVAVVVTADLGELGRCRPGDEVVFVPVDRVAAAQALARLDQEVEAAVVGRYPLTAG